MGRGAPIALIADDFGLCSDVNQAILRAHRQGVLTGASLMVAGGGFAEAVEIARRNPSLEVGLHLVLVDGRPVLPPEQVSHLVDARGRFFRSAFRAGLGCLRARASGQLERELAAQFRRYAETGLPLRHVDGHLQMHLHPAVLTPLVRLARQHGAPRIRVPRDDFALACRFDPSQRLRKLARLLALKPLIRRGLRRLRQEGFAVTDACYGLLQSGRMREDYVLAVLGQVSGSAELYFHPTRGPRRDPLGPNPGDLRTLLSSAVRAAVEQLAERAGGEDEPRPLAQSPRNVAVPCSSSS